MSVPPAGSLGRLGVLLMTYGSPASSDDMPRYLAAVRGGRPAAAEVVAEFRRRYDVIGGSPLIPITQAQAAAVKERLRAEGVDVRATAGMGFSEPTIGRALRELAVAGCDLVAAIIMSPQYSQLLMNGYQRALAAAANELRHGTPEICLAPAWYRHNRFLTAVTDRIQEGLDRLPADERARVPVLLTAHSVPRRVADGEPAYLEQLRDTAELVAARAGLAPDRWRFCWQSAGHEPGEWMKPDFADVVPQLRREGHRSVLVAPIQFLSDHLEILYDIDVGAREQAVREGLAFARIESLNLHPEFVACLADVALDATS
jgi:protoporphyrin/coproporphyrin ferrochelatase